MKIKSYIYAMALCALAVCPACSDDPNDEFTLSGNIDDLFPSYSCTLEAAGLYANNTSYVMLDVNMRANLELWDLEIKNVEYYVDGMLVGTKSNAPFTFNYESTNLSTGSHSGLAKITIAGGNEAYANLSRKTDFYIQSPSSSNKNMAIIKNMVGENDQFEVKVIENSDADNTGFKINKVDFYWDSSLQKTLTSAPFVWTKEITSQAGTQNQLRVSVNYTNGSASNNSYTYNSTVKVLSATSFDVSFNLLFTDYTYKAGDTMCGYAQFFKGKDFKENRILELSIDGEPVKRVKSFPEEVKIPLTKLSSGIHELSTKWISVDKNGNESGWFSQGGIYFLILD